MGNKRKSAVTRAGTYELIFDSVRVTLNNFCYSPEMDTNIISFHALFRQGFRYGFDYNDGTISVYRNGPFIFKDYHCEGVYETIVFVNELSNNVYNNDSCNSLDKV